MISTTSSENYGISQMVDFNKIKSHVANETFHTDRPDLSECFQLSVLAWLPCIYLWAAFPVYVYYLKKSSRGYIMMSILNRFKTWVTGELVPISSSLWAKGGVHPGQVASPSQGITHTTMHTLIHTPKGNFRLTN
ncbi:hypothetical protein ILYODFUR_020500 [Ilyodon furcidens]|uniref:ATP synthase F0 subunit 8 n=1 Tax=Ilyodon furcidens TaxID=33524 RepID=A0ABV0T9V5_9TELE